MVDFVAEFTKSVASEGKGTLNVMTTSTSVVSTWEVYTNGATNRKGARVGIMLVTLEKLVMEKSLQLGFLATNNEAEYETLLARMGMVNQLK